jgi:hypothetical protein
MRLPTARRLALGAVAGSVLFTLAWVILGFVSPGFTVYDTVIEPYSPISQPISGLGLGLTAPYMNAAFVLSGLLILVGVMGTFHIVPGMDAGDRVLCTVLVALSPVGMVIDGLFTIESFMAHMIGFLLGSGSLVLSFLIVGRKLGRIPGWRTFGRWLIIASPLTLGLVILSLATFDLEAAAAGQGIAGLTERILLIEVMGTFAVLGWLGYRRSLGEPGRQP